MAGFTIGTNSVGRDEGMSEGIHGWPTEISLQKGQGAADSWVAGELRSVDPLENLGMDWVRHKETIWWTITWVRLRPIGLLNHSLYLRDNCSHDTGWWEDGFRTLRCLLRDVLVRKSI